MKHANKILSIVAVVIFIGILSKLSCHAQRVPMHTLTNAVPIPNTITEHKDGTNIIRTQMWRVQEILQILVSTHDESRVVPRSEMTTYSPVLITNPQPVAVKAPRRPPPAVKPTNLSRGEIMRQERRRQLTNSPAIKK